MRGRQTGKVMKLRAYCAVAFLGGVLLAGCQTAGPPAGFTPDPKLKTATARQLEDEVWRTCLRTQQRLGTDSTTSSKGCRCYATGTLKAFTPEETGFYRNNGYFNDSGRTKGLAALNACGLKLA